MQNFHRDLTGKYHIVKVIHNNGGTSKSGKHLIIDRTKYRCVTSVTIEYDGILYTATSRCSIKDQWVRKIGYKIALGRALKGAAGLSTLTSN